MSKPVKHSPAPIAYSLQDAADAVGVSLTTIKQVIAAGDLNPRYLNSKRLIPATELVEWVESLPLEKTS